MTDEKKAAAAAKRSATYQRKREQVETERRDRERAYEIARAIRDNPDSTDRDRLDAVLLLERMKKS